MFIYLRQIAVLIQILFIINAIFNTQNYCPTFINIYLFKKLYKSQ